MADNHSNNSQRNSSGNGQNNNKNTNGNSEMIPDSTDAKKRAGAAAQGRRGAISGPASVDDTTIDRVAAGVAALTCDARTTGRRNAIAGVLDGTEGSLNQDSAAGKK